MRAAVNNRVVAVAIVATLGAFLVGWVLAPLVES